MKIVDTEINKLKPSEYNPRQMTEKQVEDLTKSIKEFGLVDPIICNKDFTIIGGHQRVKIVKSLGYKTVPVYFVDLTKEKEKELNIRLNKNLGEWDWDLLSNFNPEELIEFGFEEKELIPEDNIKETIINDKKSNRCPKCGYEW